MGDPIDMRLMGTQEDLDRWAWFLGECEKRQLITILEKSKSYPNRGDSKLVRLYIKIKLNVEE
jgi:hypothetical protein